MKNNYLMNVGLREKFYNDSYDSDLNNIKFVYGFIMIFCIYLIFFSSTIRNSSYDVYSYILLGTVILIGIVSFAFMYKGSFPKANSVLMILFLSFSDFTFVSLYSFYPNLNEVFVVIFLLIFVFFYFLRFQPITMLVIPFISIFYYLLLSYFIALEEVNYFVIFFTVFMLKLGAVFATLKYFEFIKKFYIINNELQKQSNKLLQMYDAKNVQYEDSHRKMIYALVKLVEKRDVITGKHVERVSEMSVALAALLDETYFLTNWSKESFCSVIYVASALHDIGKVSLADTILNKPDKLDAGELVKMKDHTIMGFEILTEMQRDYVNNDYIKMGIEIALNHHENFDGNGYPNNKSKYDIPLSARIVAIVDTYDALRSERYYKKEYSHSKTISIMKELSGKKFDPEILNIFMQQKNIFNDLYNKMADSAL